MEEFQLLVQSQVLAVEEVGCIAAAVTSVMALLVAQGVAVEVTVVMDLLEALPHLLDKAMLEAMEHQTILEPLVAVVVLVRLVRMAVEIVLVVLVEVEAHLLYLARL
jgi:hypothetical protein